MEIDVCKKKTLSKGKAKIMETIEKEEKNQAYYEASSSSDIGMDLETKVFAKNKEEENYD